MARVYVSSTFYDLKDYRETVRNALRKLGHEDIAMEYYVAGPQRPVNKCLYDVASCELYIGIFALRYGFIPEGFTQSITELEYRQAKERGIDCLIFLADEETWPAGKIEREAWGKIDRLRQELKENELVSTFSSQEELCSLMTTAVANWMAERGLLNAIDRTDWEAYQKAVVKKWKWIPLTAIATSEKDAFAPVSLAEVFTPQMLSAGTPEHEVSEEALTSKEAAYATHRNLLPEEEGKEERPLSPKPEPGEPEGEAPGDSEPIKEAYPEPVLEVFMREPAQVYLGGPGSGKSTLVHYIMLTLCDADFPTDRLPRQLQQRPLPFLIELRQFVLDKTESDFTSYIVKSATEFIGASIQKESLEELFKSEKRAVVIFDGLDEIFDRQQRERTIHQFTAFQRLYPAVSIIVTSRIAGYSRYQIGVSSFQHYTLQDFTMVQVKQFVPKWYKWYTLEGTERTAQGLIQRISESPRLMDLAGNPLLLTMMAVIYKNQDLPENRWQLYQLSSNVLLEIWDRMAHAIKVEIEFGNEIAYIRAPQKAQILQRVSVYMLEHKHPRAGLNAIDLEPLLSILVEYLRENYDKKPGQAQVIAEDILVHLRERTYILAEIGKAIYGFVHRTFMEYFAACYYRDKFKSLRSDYDWLIKEVFVSHWAQPEWQEVLYLLIGMLSHETFPIKDLITYMREKINVSPPTNLAFAARCLSEAGENGVREDSAYASQLMVALAEQIAFFAGQKKKEAREITEEFLKAFISLGPLVEAPEPARRKGEALTLASTQRERIVGWQMTYALLSRRERKAFALAALKDKTQDETVRRGAVEALEREWPGLPDVGQALIELAGTDSIARVRQKALQALQDAWPAETAVLDAIEKRVDDETAYTHVMWLIQYLADNWPGYPRALRLILREAGSKPKAEYDYPYPLVQNKAAETILGIYIIRPETYTLLLEAARENPDVRIKTTALRALVTNWPDKAEVIDLTRQLVEKGQNPADTQAILEAILTSKSHSPQLLESLRSWAIRQNFGREIRKTVIECLGELGKGDAEILRFLRELAVQDNETSLRIAALQTLAEHWSEEPGLAEFLRGRVMQDQAPEVQTEALNLLLGGRLEDQANLEFLRGLIEAEVKQNLQAAAIKALGKGFAAQPGVFDYLMKIAESSPKVAKRLAGLEAVAEAYQDALPVVELLYHKLARDKSKSVRRRALEMIINSPIIEKEATLRVLLERADQEKDNAVRARIIWGLGAFWGYDPEVHQLMQFRYLLDHDPSVRAIALASLVAGQPPGAEIKEIARQSALNDPDPYVRTCALFSLYFHGATWDAYRYLEMWKERAGFEFPRWVDRRLLAPDFAQYYSDINFFPYSYRNINLFLDAEFDIPDDPRELEFIKDRLDNDPDNMVFALALTLYTRCFPREQAEMLLRELADHLRGEREYIVRRYFYNYW